jgi:hypothetical protein
MVMNSKEHGKTIKRVQDFMSTVQEVLSRGNSKKEKCRMEQCSIRMEKVLRESSFTEKDMEKESTDLHREWSSSTVNGIEIGLFHDLHVFR